MHDPAVLLQYLIVRAGSNLLSTLPTRSPDRRRSVQAEDSEEVWPKAEHFLSHRELAPADCTQRAAATACPHTKERKTYGRARQVRRELQQTPAHVAAHGHRHAGWQTNRSHPGLHFGIHT